MTARKRKVLIGLGAVAVVLIGYCVFSIARPTVLRDTSGKETTFTPELLAVEPGRELRWIGKVGFGGIFDGEHSFRIEALPGGRSRLIQQETFRGVAVPVMTGWLDDKIKPQFAAMNQALATRAAALG
jgi:hypothetical protein